MGAVPLALSCRSLEKRDGNEEECSLRTPQGFKPTLQGQHIIWHSSHDERGHPCSDGWDISPNLPAETAGVLC